VKRELARRIMALPWRRKLSLAWRMWRDPGVPAPAKALLPVLAAYLGFPFDIIPDFIPVLGQLDDLLVVALGLSAFVWLTPYEVIEHHLVELE
jgi:uncharacterized membrane protein YkvA (DUF1232 family)